MATTLNDFVEPVRALLNDNDPAGIYQIDTEEIMAAMRLVLNIGKVPFTIGQGTYAVSGPNIVPDLTPSDPVAYAIFVFNVAKIFTNAMQRESFNTRAFSESIGEPRELIDAVVSELYRLENGEQFS